jgi:methylated-DNA-[protein]-cysteine S-methyltransferase
MDACGHALLPTPIGTCGIAWSARGIAAFQLPESTVARTRARLLRRLTALGLGDAARAAAESATPWPHDVRHAVDAVLALLDGERVDLRFVALDDADIAPFERRVYTVTRDIAPGTTRSYGEVAVAIGEPDAARAVGQALGRNPWAVIVPCHRVLAAGGAIGGFSAGGGAATKRRLLAIERARAGAGPDLFADENGMRTP